jgi:hypothetical protein
MDSIHYAGNNSHWKALLSIEVLSAEVPPLEESAKRRTQRPRTVAQRPFSAFPRRQKTATISACPFNEANTSSPEFLEKLRHGWQTGEPPPKADGHLRIVVAYPKHFIGEISESQRLKNAFGHCGHECCLCTEEMYHLAKQISPDLFIAMYPTIAPPEGMLSALRWAGWNEDNVLDLATRYENVLFTNQNIEFFEKRAQKKVRGVQLFSSAAATDFCDTSKNSLFFCGSLYDARRRVHYAPLYQLLDGTDYFETYGPTNSWERMRLKSYRGYITAEGNSLLRLMQKAGVALVLHADQHLASCSPMARIFEAAAASCVIICDMHPWVMKHFGNSVLYVDQNASPEEMFRQIDGHMKWIHEHPQEAIELARRSHSIFVENFALEGEVEKIENFIREILAEKANN